MRRDHLFYLLAAGAFAGLTAVGACSASKDGSDDDDGPSGPGPGPGGSGPSTTTDGGGGQSLLVGGGGTAGGGGIIVDPCNSECGDTELCGEQAVALDDNCNGEVDEGCPCASGTAQACFKGEPAYVDADGCFPGTQSCSELGVWGPCEGGVHATDGCYMPNTGCHAISGYPFVTANLKDGTGDFSMGAITESWTVTCPPGVNNCPMVTGTNPADDFQPQVSGEYTVTYSKTDANGPDMCTYPLFVGAPGLRVELDWEHDLGGSGVDLDLHMHQPMDTTPWGGNFGNAVDCAYNNCTASAYMFSGGVDWFMGVAPPDPVDWFLDPVFEKNTCYFAPKGAGADWQQMGMGCHNPRLDSDDITCDPLVTDPQNFSFCNAENINVDYPPQKQWIRIGVHYYSSHGLLYTVHPNVKIFCNGKLAAELGAHGFGTPQEVPVAFPSSGSDVMFWLVADVLFQSDECNEDICKVEPLYLDQAQKSALLVQTSSVQSSFSPGYPPVPP
jgi:hypothetical protein